jgi:hypothetical protein
MRMELYSHLSLPYPGLAGTVSRTAHVALSVKELSGRELERLNQSNDVVFDRNCIGFKQLMHFRRPQ